jgi:hypothetical protein
VEAGTRKRERGGGVSAETRASPHPHFKTSSNPTANRKTNTTSCARRTYLPRAGGRLKVLHRHNDGIYDGGKDHPDLHPDTAHHPYQAGEEGGGGKVKGKQPLTKVGMPAARGTTHATMDGSHTTSSASSWDTWLVAQFLWAPVAGSPQCPPGTGPPWYPPSPSRVPTSWLHFRCRFC